MNYLTHQLLNSQELEVLRKKLKDNLDNFFVKEIQPMFDEPSFFGKLFGNTPENRALKIKKQLVVLKCYLTSFLLILQRFSLN